MKVRENLRAWQILHLVVMEWKSDPHSVQCFDRRIVEEAIELMDRNLPEIREIEAEIDELEALEEVRDEIEVYERGLSA